jgi:hypothetical protein
MIFYETWPRVAISLDEIHVNARPVCWPSLARSSVPTEIFAAAVRFFTNILHLKGAE